MTLMIIAGVWALAFGHITLTQSLKMRDNEARLFGVALIIVAAYGLPYLNGWLGGYTHKYVSNNEALRMAYDQLVGAFATYITAFVLTRVIPRLKVPSVTISFKRLRARA